MPVFRFRRPRDPTTSPALSTATATTTSPGNTTNATAARRGTRFRIRIRIPGPFTLSRAMWNKGKRIRRRLYPSKFASRYKNGKGEKRKWIKRAIFTLPMLLIWVLVVILSKLSSLTVHVKTKAMKTNVDGVKVEVTRYKGRLTIQMLPYLPLRQLSRLYGHVFSLPLPRPLRVPVLRLYAYAFNADLTEIYPPNLSSYKSLSAFFNRRLRPGARPIADRGVVSPADGTLIHCGVVDTGGHVEQVKGLTYSLDALLGVESESLREPILAKGGSGKGEVVDEQEFASVNGIEYSLNELIGSSGSTKISQPDASVSQSTLDNDLDVLSSLNSKPRPPPKRPAPLKRTSTISPSTLRPGNLLHFAVVYLGPGDYHRFHAPVPWVVERRRHFAGELLSVNPFLAKRLRNLFVLNERVALLGRWSGGFFGMVPVGATNVGSIKVNFDTELRTNMFRFRRRRPGTYSEASYAGASPLLGGQPVKRGEEMGAFLLGSTIVLVFEAPAGFAWARGAGEKVKVGEVLGDVAG